MASIHALPDVVQVGKEAAFCSVLQSVSSSLGSQVHLAGGCLAFHPSPPPGFRDNANQALARLRTAVDEFWLDIAHASGPSVALCWTDLASAPQLQEAPAAEPDVLNGQETAKAPSPPWLDPLEPLQPARRTKQPLKAGSQSAAAGLPAHEVKPCGSEEEEEEAKVHSHLWLDPLEPRQPSRRGSFRASSHSAATTAPGCEAKPCESEPNYFLNQPVPSERPCCGTDCLRRDSLLPAEEAATKLRNSWDLADIRRSAMSQSAPGTASMTASERSEPLAIDDPAGGAPPKIGNAISFYSSKGSEPRRLPSTENVHLEPTETENVATFAAADSVSTVREESAQDGEPFIVRGALNPNWNGRLGWDFGVIAIVLVDAMVLPFQMAYKHGNDPDAFDMFWLWMTTTFFSLDMVISFFTAYTATKSDTFTESGRLVTQRCRIVRHYLRGWFTIDFVSTIPWSVFADLLADEESGGNSAQVAKLTKVVKFVRFLRLMRMLRLAKLGIIWERIEAKMGSLILLQIVALIRVLFIVISICHWNACIWWMVGQPQSLFTELLSDEGQAQWEAKPHWTVLKRSHDANGELWSWIEKDKVEAYVFCFYWTLGVMRTMPSEVQPVNLAERIYVMLFMFFAVSAFAISVTLITQAFLKIGERRRIFNEDMAFARMHLRNIQASEQLQMKVKAYLTHLFNRRRIQAKESNLFTHLPAPLTKLMKFSTIMVFLKSVEILSNLGKKALYAVSEISDVTDLIPNERLSTRGMTAQAAFIVMEGFLRIVGDRWDHMRRLSDSEDMVEPSIKIVDGECLGSRRSCISEHTVVARTACEVIVISKRRFANLLKENPSLFARISVNDEEKKHRASGSSDFSCLELTADTDLANVDLGFERGTSGESFIVEESPASRTVAKSASHTAAIIST